MSIDYVRRSLERRPFLHFAIPQIENKIKKPNSVVTTDERCIRTVDTLVMGCGN